MLLLHQYTCLTPTPKHRVRSHSPFATVSTVSSPNGPAMLKVLRRPPPKLYDVDDSSPPRTPSSSRSMWQPDPRIMPASGPLRSLNANAPLEKASKPKQQLLPRVKCKAHSNSSALWSSLLTLTCFQHSPPAWYHDRIVSRLEIGTT